MSQPDSANRRAMPAPIPTVRPTPVTRAVGRSADCVMPAILLDLRRISNLIPPARAISSAGEGDGGFGASGGGGGERDGALVGPGDFLGDGQAEAGAAAGSGATGVGADEALEDALAVRLGDAVAVVLHGDHRGAVLLSGRQPDAGVSGTGRIVDEIPQHLTQPRRIADDPHWMYVTR